MFLRECDSVQRAHSHEISRIDVRKLPQRMEELVVMDGSWPEQVFVSELPPAMRLFAILNRNIHSAVVDYAQLPASVQMLLFLSRKKVKVTEVGRLPADTRVETNCSRQGMVP